jgi:hypothetical protein
MSWNDLDYETQCNALEKIANLITRECGDSKTALIAAFQELDLWSNRPCSDESKTKYIVAHNELDNDVVEASDSFNVDL